MNLRFKWKSSIQITFKFRFTFSLLLVFSLFLFCYFEWHLPVMVGWCVCSVWTEQTTIEWQIIHVSIWKCVIKWCLIRNDRLVVRLCTIRHIWLEFFHLIQCICLNIISMLFVQSNYLLFLGWFGYQIRIELLN